MLTFFIVNRHASETIGLEVDLQGFAGAALADHQVMTSPSLEAANTLRSPLTVTPYKGANAAVGEERLTAKLPPYSYQMIRLSLS